jgi:regulator of replication initiation timing
MELIKVENEIGILDTEVSKKVAEFEKAIKEIKEKEEELKQNILSEMESKNILKLETDDLTITYIAPSEKETFDSKKFREENSDLYDEYVKFSPVKSSIRVKVK